MGQLFSPDLSHNLYLTRRQWVLRKQERATWCTGKLTLTVQAIDVADVGSHAKEGDIPGTVNLQVTGKQPLTRPRMAA